MATSDRRSARGLPGAFTLVEVLLIIAIMVLLLSVLLPEFGRARASARAAKCASNLHQVHGAVQVREQAGVLDRALGPLKSRYWAQAVHDQLASAGGGSVLLCPDDDEPARGGVSELVVRVFTGGTPAPHPPPHDMRYFLWDMKFSPAPNPLMRKKELGPGRYELDFEDQIDGGDMSFRNVVLEVEEKPNGSIVITPTQAAGSYHWDLYDPVAQETLVHCLRKTAPLGRPVVLGMGGLSSYGMNKASDGLSARAAAGSELIYLLDYENIVANVDPLDDPDDWSDWLVPETGLPRFARHQGRSNVLFLDGSIRRLSPGEIDPAIGRNRARWLGQ